MVHGEEQQENHSRHNLNHELVFDRVLDGHTIPLEADVFKQPSADKEETRQAKQEKHIIPAHPHISYTEATDMGIDHEDHRESSHRINVFYPLFCHYVCKDTELFTIYHQ